MGEAAQSALVDTKTRSREPQKLHEQVVTEDPQVYVLALNRGQELVFGSRRQTLAGFDKYLWPLFCSCYVRIFVSENSRNVK